MPGGGVVTAVGQGKADMTISLNPPIIQIDNVNQWLSAAYRDGDFVNIEDVAPIVAPPFECAVFLYKENDRNYFLRYETVETNDGEIKWVVVIHIYSRRDSEKELSYMASSRVGILADGTIAKDFSQIYATEEHYFNCPDIRSAVFTVMLPMFMSISLMHCKNIELVDEPMSRQVRRRKERKGEVVYKVLAIEPFKQQVRRQVMPGESEIKKALHICRGHFATYTDKKPLFGKYTGTFWRSMHVRGNAEQGKVVKDYTVDVR